MTGKNRLLTHIQRKWVIFSNANNSNLLPILRILELTESECKLQFLQFLQQQETFGSTFFVVNQKTISSYPETLLIAINRNGFHIMDSVKKVRKRKYFEHFQTTFFHSNC
jgi:myosin VIIa